MLSIKGVVRAVVIVLVTTALAVLAERFISTALAVIVLIFGIALLAWMHDPWKPYWKRSVAFAIRHWVICGSVPLLLVCCFGIWIHSSSRGAQQKADAAIAAPPLPKAEEYLQFSHATLAVDPNTPLFVAGKRLMLTFVLQNASSVGVARDVTMAVGLTYIAPGKGLEVKEEDRFNQFRSDWLSVLPRMKTDEIGAGDNRVRDVESKPLQQPLIRGLEREEVHLYAFGDVKWTDETGTWETQTCSHFLVRRSTLTQAIWKECGSGEKHNFIRHLFSVVQ